MKKTVSIHIKGFPFTIEEDAYSRLENYLKRLKSALNGQEGEDEIIEDIEIRIAELLNERRTETKQIIEDKDVIDVLNTLGNPSDYAESDDTSQSQNNQSFHSQNTEKKLYRDTENGYIGGVCEGLANYFNIDATIIRVIWAILTFGFGFGFLLYILLWIFVPKAKTSLDRLRMKGAPINFDSVKEEVNRAANTVADKSKQFANEIKEKQVMRRGISMIAKIVRIVFGVFLLIFGFIFLSTLIGILFGTPTFGSITKGNEMITSSDLSALIFNNSGDYRLAWISVIMCLASLMGLFILGGLVSVFNLKNKWYRRTNISLVIICIVGVTIGIIAASRISKEYAIEGELEKEIATLNSPSLTILTPTNHTTAKDDFISKRKHRWELNVGEKEILQSGVRIDYRHSIDSSFHIIIEKEANSSSLVSAEKKAGNIVYDYTLKNDTLLLPTHFSYPKKDKIRGQQVKIVVRIPKGKTVSYNNEIINLDETISDDDDDDDDFHERKSKKTIRRTILINQEFH